MVDPKQYRQALGNFATGVAVISAPGPGGTPIRITANSFNSVSVDPPLVYRRGKFQPIGPDGTTNI